MAKSNQDYKNEAKALKKLGFLNTDLRKKLTPGKKAAITRQKNAAKKWGPDVYDSVEKEVKNPKRYQELAIANVMGDRQSAQDLRQKLKTGKHETNFYQVKNLSNKKALKDFQAMGYRVKGNKVFIPVKPQDWGHPIYVRPGKSPSGKKIFHLTRVKDIGGSKKIQITFIQPKSAIMSELKTLEENGDKLPPFTRATVSIGDNNPFKYQAGSYSELMNYITNWEPKDDKREETRQKLISAMHLVHVDIDPRK